MLSRTVVTLAIAMFSATLGVGIVAPVLPVRAEELGATGAQVGLTFSAFAITQLLISPFVGRIADRYGRKQFILLGVSTYVVAALGWRETESIEVMIALRALTGIGSGLIFALVLSYIGDLAPAGQQGRYMGFFGFFEFLGFGAGPVVSGVLRDAAGFDAVFLAMAGMLTTSGLVILFFLPWSLDRSELPGGVDQPPEPLASWGELLRTPICRGCLRSAWDSHSPSGRHSRFSRCTSKTKSERRRPWLGSCWPGRSCWAVSCSRCSGRSPIDSIDACW